jgi:multidrug efflux system membrane fusion protein
MKKSVITALILAAIAGAWIVSGQFAPKDANGNDKPTASAPAASAPMQVRVAELKAAPRTETVDVTGRTEAARKVAIRAETRGQVAEILAMRGDTVAAGAPIARLRPDDRPAKLAEAKAMLRQRSIEHEAASQLQQKGFRSQTEEAAARARLDAARAVVEQIEIDIAHTTIRAPFSGMLDAGHVELGDYVQVGDIAATVVDLEPILVVGNVTERQVGHIEEGMPAMVRLIDGGERTGIVRFVSPVAEPSTRTYRVEIEVPNPDRTVRDGITAQIEIPISEARAHFVTPSTLTLNDDGAVGVKVVDDTDTVHFLPVEIIADEPGGVWLGGLPETVRLIIVGQEFVVEGESVKPVTGTARISGAGET